MASGNIYHGGLNFSGTEVTVTPNAENQSVELARYTLDGVSGTIKMPGKNVAIIPQMTGYTTPSGAVVESSRFNNNMYGWKAFDGVQESSYNYTHAWLAKENDSAPYLIYQFTEKHRLSKLWIETYNNSTSVTKTLYVQGATNSACTEWENCLKEGTSTTITANDRQNVQQTYILNNKKYYGIKISGDSIWMIVNGSNVAISRMQVYDITYGNEEADDNWSRNHIGTTEPSDSVGNEKDQYFKVQTTDTPITFTQLQLKVTATRGSDLATQISEVELYDSSNNLYDWTGTTVSANVSCYSGYGAEKLINGDHSSISDQMSAIIVPTAANPLIVTFNLGTPFTSGDVTTWKWYTASDAQLRDPISFVLSGSPDGTTWYELDSATNATITTTRSTLAYTGSLTPQSIHDFKVDKVYLKTDGVWEEYTTGGGGGTGDYEELGNLPSINGVTLIGNKTSSNLGIAITLTQAEYDELSDLEKNDPNKVYYISDGECSQNIIVPTPFVYSTTEEQIGFWIDGKPLYQKTIDCGLMVQDSNWHSIAHNVSNMDLTVSIDAILVDTRAGVIQQIPGISYRPTTTTGVVVLRYEQDIRYMNNWLSNNDVHLYATIKYTKTSDAAWQGGFKAYGFSPVIYSDAEREIGVWRDGKPLYQKTISGTTIAGATNVDKPHGISNLGEVAYCEIWTHFSDTGYWRKLNFAYDNGSSLSAWYGGYLISDANIRYQLGSYYAQYIDKWYATIQYTKTTDTAGSGKYTTIGTPTIHYDENEQIIGTWINGKPLYQKTVSCGALPNANTKQVSHGISNIGTVVKIFGYTNGGLGTLPLPYSTNNINANIGVNVPGDNTAVINLFTGSDRSNLINTYVTLQYTKTID